jgi:hypothetical protein
MAVNFGHFAQLCGHRAWNGADEWGEEARMIDPYAELKLTA